MSLNPESTFEADKALEKIPKLRDFWTAHGKEIEETLKEITGLSFAEPTLSCYLNSKKTFSIPLTLSVEKDEDMFDNLVHELIHVLLEDNLFGRTSTWQTLMEQLKEYHFTVRVHVAIHAIHLLVASKLFPDRVERIKSYSVLPRYMKAWDLVKEMGAENITKALFSLKNKE